MAVYEWLLPSPAISFIVMVHLSNLTLFNMWLEYFTKLGFVPSLFGERSISFARGLAK